MDRRVKAILALSVVVLTALVFGYYVNKHPLIWHQLRATPPGLIALLLLLYVGFMASQVLMTNATLRLSKSKLKLGETGLITAYSAIINFFGPLQSGPAFRGAYLKKRHNTSLKLYAKATLAYYAFYGGICVLFLLSGIIGAWAWLLLAIGLCAAYLISKNKQWLPASMRELDLKQWYLLALATALQLGFSCVIFYLEIHHLAPHTSFGQAVIYTGAGSLALFVSITPGAIGFRESFLVFSERLHHISSSVIVAANLIDRAVYVTFLLFMALLIFGTHTNKMLKSRTEN